MASVQAERRNVVVGHAGQVRTHHGGQGRDHTRPRRDADQGPDIEVGHLHRAASWVVGSWCRMLHRLAKHCKVFRVFLGAMLLQDACMHRNRGSRLARQRVFLRKNSGAEVYPPAVVVALGACDARIVVREVGVSAWIRRIAIIHALLICTGVNAVC